ncbi:MAG TPA: DUF222 domain-containing protein [Acidimicrobiia bacterium]|nr:DUF222 domain-containing protein [Acidimicrobiia bacterium]
MFDDGYEAIPPLEDLEPGPVLSALLASLDPDRVSPHDQVRVVRAQQRMASHHQAQMYAAVAAIADHMDTEPFSDDPELAWEASATEIRAALRLTRRSAEGMLDVALGLRRRLPRVWRALSRGRIDLSRARVILTGTTHLDDVTATVVARTVLADAPRLTTGELSARIRRLSIEVEPESAKKAYEDSVEDRRVVVEANPEGTANLLGLNLPPHQVMAIRRRIDRLAKTLRRAGDPLSIDQIRADVYLDLLTGRHRDAKGGMVDLHVDLATLTELTETPGELAGYGPVVADIARQIAEAQANGEWRYTIFDPETGLPVHSGTTTKRRHTASQRRSVQTRERVCYFPGCRTPATECDLDHRVPWSRRRQTSAGGSDPGCRHDHLTVRHAIGWRHQILPNGDHLWTSPLGHHYTKSGRPP